MFFIWEFAGSQNVEKLVGLPGRKENQHIIDCIGLEMIN